MKNISFNICKKLSKYNYQIDNLDKETVLVLSTDGEFLKYLGSAK